MPREREANEYKQQHFQTRTLFTWRNPPRPAARGFRGTKAPSLPHLHSQDALVDVGGEDGSGGQQSRVGGRHHGRCHRPDPDDGDVGRGEVLQDDGQDESGLSSLKWRWRTVRRQVPVWENEPEHSFIHPFQVDAFNFVPRRLDSISGCVGRSRKSDISVPEPYLWMQPLPQGV